MNDYPCWIPYHRILIFVLMLWAAPAHSYLVISEVYYDAPGQDSGKAFVELYGLPGTALEGYSLLGINGANGSIYRTVALSGRIPDNAVFVIGDDDVTGNTLVMNVNLVANVDFQNGPDSIVLWDGDVAVDAIGYGNFSGAVFAGEGSPASDAGAGKSLFRWSPADDTDNNAIDFHLSGVPTPGTVPLPSVPLPGALWCFISGLCLLGLRAR